MNFNSEVFGLFILCVFTLYFTMQRMGWWRAQKWMLLGASYLFYGSWDHRFLFLIILSTAVDYCCGLGMVGKRPSGRLTAVIGGLLAGSSVVLCGPFDWGAVFSLGHAADGAAGAGLLQQSADWSQATAALLASAAFGIACRAGYHVGESRRRRYFLLFSLVSNLTLLGFFKYFDFFVDSAQTALAAIGYSSESWALGIVVPVGISFYTFQTLSYTIDIYRRELEPTESLVDFSLFVAFFPQLVAGPIERARVLLPQLAEPRGFDWTNVQTGTYMAGWGLFKKIFIADNLARLVNPVFESYAAATGPEVAMAACAFAFQVYCDFSGYSDIARGISRIMGVELMVNFNVPFIATNPSEFWRRWHISLSTWLRDYLYVGLGGNRGTSLAVYRNLMLTMVLGGLWHGARANFVIWGVYEGALLCTHRAIAPKLEALQPRTERGRLAFHLLCWAVFFVINCYGFLIFRVETGAQLVDMSIALLTGWGDLPSHIGTLARLVWFVWPLVLIQFFEVRSNNLLDPLTWRWPYRMALYVVFFYLTTIFGAYDIVEFIYFQF